MAADIVALAAALGHDRFALAGHDWGALVAIRAGLDHPRAVSHLAILDVLPTLYMWDVLHGVSAAVAFHLYLLFAPDGAPDRRLMRYRLQFADAEGQPRTLSGQKDIWHGAPTRIWPDTSTLYFRLLEGHVAEGQDDQARTLAMGTLHLSVEDFARQCTTIRAEGPHRVAALERFGLFFAGQLWDVYGPQRAHC